MRAIGLGNTGVEVSVFCLGTMHFRTRISPEMSVRLLDQYAEAGGSFLDSANIYARWVAGHVSGESETLQGEWIQENLAALKLRLSPEQMDRSNSASA